MSYVADLNIGSALVGMLSAFLWFRSCWIQANVSVGWFAEATTLNAGERLKLATRFNAAAALGSGLSAALMAVATVIGTVS